MTKEDRQRIWLETFGEALRAGLSEWHQPREPTDPMVYNAILRLRDKIHRRLVETDDDVARNKDYERYRVLSEILRALQVSGD